MYSEEQFKKQIKLLHDFYRNPVKQLAEISGLSRPTVERYLAGVPLRMYNQDILYKSVLKMKEEAIAYQKTLTKRGDKIFDEASILNNIQQQG